MTCSRDRTWPEIVKKIRCYGVSLVWIMFGLWITVNIFLAHKKSTSVFSNFDGLNKKSLIRNKRFIFMDNQRRLSLPTGSILALSSVVSLPFLGNLPIGYGSGLTIAVPLTVKFDDLGMTSPDNRFGYFDFLNFTEYFGIPRLNLSAMRLPSVLAPTQFPNRLQNNLPNVLIERPKRSTWKNYPGVNYAGGDREMIYQVVEDFLSSFGLDGPGCVIRAICEMHEEPLFNYGFFGEALNLVLSPSLAAFAEYRLGSYLKAEQQGKERRECSMYHKQCKYSLFSPKSLYKREHPFVTNFTDFDVGEFNNTSNITFSSLHHRQKRFFMFGPTRRIIFPPSTAAVGTPTLNLPFLRDLPDGYKSQLSYSIPFTLSFDDLGLTSILNNFGDIPLLSLFGKRRKREADDILEGINYAGGDREMMYAVVADALNKIGMNGEACIRRVICETHEMPLINHGLFGEFFQLFLTPSLAPRATERLNSFVKAEQLGKKCGDCGIYFSQCSSSLFTNPQAGIRFSNETELSECKRRHSMEYREEKMELIQAFKTKYRKVKKKPNWSSKFVQEIANGENRKLLFKKI